MKATTDFTATSNYRIYVNGLFVGTLFLTRIEALKISAQGFKCVLSGGAQ